MSLAVGTSLAVATLEPSHSSQRSRGPNRPEKIGIGTRSQSENAPESPLDADFHPMVVKIAKIDFSGRLEPKMVPEWALRAASWDPRDP